MSIKEEEWELLGKSIGLQLRKLKSRDLTIAQKLISDIIFYAKMGRLSEDTRIDLGSDCSSSSSSYLNHDQHRTKLSHPSPRYIVLSPSPSLPSPQYYSSFPQYHVQSPNTSHAPQIHIPDPEQLQTSNTQNNTVQKINIQEFLIFDPNYKKYIYTRKNQRIQDDRVGIKPTPFGLPVHCSNHWVTEDPNESAESFQYIVFAASQ